MADNDSQDGRRGVSRRRFVEAAGVSGAATGLSGCLGLGLGGGGGGGTTTIQWATDSDIKDNWENGLKSALYDGGGLSKDVEVELLAMSDDSGARQSQYQQWLGANRAKPDVLHTDVGWTIPFIARKQLKPLKEVFSDSQLKEIKDEHFEAQLSSARAPNGDLYGVPVYPDFPIMHYRKDLVKEAGYDPSDWATNALSWKKMSKVAKDTMDQTNTEHGFTFQAKNYVGLSCCDFNEWITSQGGAFFGDPTQYLSGPVGDRPITVDEQPVVDSIKMVRTFIHGNDAPNTLDSVTGNISPTTVLQWIENPSLKPFTSGNAVFHRNWPYATVQSKNSFSNFQDMYGVTPICKGVDAGEGKYPRTGGPVSSLGGWNSAVNPNTENTEAVKEFLLAMKSDEFRLKMFELIGWIPAKPSLFESDRAKQVEPTGQFLPTLKISGENAMARPVTPVWPTQSTKISTAVNDSLSKGGTAPQKAMNGLKSTLQDIESNYSGN